MVKDQTTLVKDAATRRLEQQLAEKRELYNTMFPKEPMTYEQELARDTRNAERNLASITERLEAARKGQFGKPIEGSKPWSQELSDLKNQQKAAREEIAELRKAANAKTPEEIAEAKYNMQVKRAIKATERSIERVKQEMSRKARGEEKKISGQGVWSKELSDLKNELKSLKEMDNPKLSMEEKAINAKIRGMERSIKEMNRRMTEGDYGKKERKDIDISGSPKALAAQQELLATREKFEAMKAKAEWDALSAVGKAKRFVGAFPSAQKSLLGSYDISAPGRQGWFTMLSHPVLWSKSFAPMLRSFNRQKSFQENQKIFNRKNALLYERAGLALERTNSAGDFANIEDYKRLDLVQKMEKYPVIGAFAKGASASNRAYGTALNKMRADLFDKLLATSSDPSGKNEALNRDIAEIANVLTGRGKLSPDAAKKLGFMWAPRFMQSGVDLLSGRRIWAAETKEGKKMAVKEYGRILASMTTMYAAAMLSGQEIDNDPKSGGFGNITIGGFTFNPLNHLKPLINFLARTLTGRTTIDGKEYALTTGKTFGKGRAKQKYGYDYGDVVWRFLQSKAHPSLGTAMALRRGRSFSGKETTIPRTIAEGVTPLALRQSVELEEGHTLEGIATFTVANILGAPVQEEFDYGKRKHRKR